MTEKVSNESAVAGSPELGNWFALSSQAEGGAMMLQGNRSDIIDGDMLEYLTYESKRRNVTIQEVYEEEKAAEKRASQRAFTSQELQRLVETSQPDQRLLEGDEDCPF